MGRDRRPHRQRLSRRPEIGAARSFERIIVFDLVL
jgi:hypothetical protein